MQGRRIFSLASDLFIFTPGGQITNIRKNQGRPSGGWTIFAVQLQTLGCKIEFVDIGGGLGVDYDGTRSTNASSVNYSIQEYANDVIYTITQIAR